jgi:hypothetical protein
LIQVVVKVFEKVAKTLIFVNPILAMNTRFKVKRWDIYLKLIALIPRYKSI